MASGKIATAYVQVAPSMDGVAPKVKSFFGETGTSAGSGFGINAGEMIKKALTSVDIGAALRQSLEEGADLQQSLGGIETLFGAGGKTIEEYATFVGKSVDEISGEYDNLIAAQEAVFANAENAYKTAGLSANEYMETVTSFSASLISSMGGDTQEAARVADMALTDMSDNANKMGSDMESLQNAYQGFAKGQYQLLDNLKLGYGGTKSEMERLLKDAQKLTGVKYDISNLADVYSAIHVIQAELGITGTTALEASTTLTGSFNSMKSAFSDVLGNLALGRPMETSLAALAETTETFLMGNLVPMVGNIFRALPGAASTLVKELIPGSVEDVAKSISSSFTSFIKNEAPNLLESGGETLRAWAEGIGDFLPELGAAAGDMIVALGEFLTSPENLMEIASTVWDVGTSIISGVWDGIVSGFNKMKEAWPKLFETLGNGVSGAQAGLNYAYSGNFQAPGFETGLDYVPYDNFLARLHEGEMVLTKNQANALRGGSFGGVVVNQYINSEAKTAADLMQEARYEQEKAVMGIG